MWGGLGVALQAVADFLIEERCHACGRLVEATERLALPRDRAAAALCAPLRLGRARLRVETRPLCRACCHDLTPAAEPIPIAPRLAVWPAFMTDDRILSVVHALKFSRHERLAPWLARSLALGLPARAFSGDDDRSATIVPVPMDRASLRRRGFNQAERLATALGGLVGSAVERRALVKTRPTAPQSSLDGAERVRNVAGIMAVAAREGIAGRLVVLVDDLVTTGATAAACAAALWDAGAADVRVVALGYRP